MSAHDTTIFQTCDKHEDCLISWEDPVRSSCPICAELKRLEKKLKAAEDRLALHEAGFGP